MKKPSLQIEEAEFSFIRDTFGRVLWCVYVHYEKAPYNSVKDAWAVLNSNDLCLSLSLPLPTPPQASKFNLEDNIVLQKGEEGTIMQDFYKFPLKYQCLNRGDYLQIQEKCCLIAKKEVVDDEVMFEFANNTGLKSFCDSSVPVGVKNYRILVKRDDDIRLYSHWYKDGLVDLNFCVREI